MSYIPFQQRCVDCGKHWNTVTGMVGNQLMGPPCVECPYCHSKNLVHHADGWEKPTPEDDRDLWGEG